MKNYILPIIIVILFMTGIKLPVYPDCPLINRFTYYLFHVNLIHLLLNLIAWVILRKMRIKWWIMNGIVILTAVISGFFATTPTLGISGGLLGVTGFAYGTNPEKNIKPTLIILSIIFISIMMPGIAGTVHLTGFISGYLISYIYGRVRGFGS